MISISSGAIRNQKSETWVGSFVLLRPPQPTGMRAHFFFLFPKENDGRDLWLVHCLLIHTHTQAGRLGAAFGLLFIWAWIGMRGGGIKILKWNRVTIPRTWCMSVSLISQNAVSFSHPTHHLWILHLNLTLSIFV